MWPVPMVLQLSFQFCHFIICLIVAEEMVVKIAVSMCFFIFHIDLGPAASVHLGSVLWHWPGQTTALTWNVSNECKFRCSGMNQHNFLGEKKGRSGERRWTPLIGSSSLWAGQKCPLCAWIDDGWWQSPEVRSTTVEATAERPILPLGECHRYRLVISDHWRWLSASKKVETFGRHFLLWAFWL